MVDSGPSPALSGAASEGSALHGPSRPDLLRDEVLPELFARTAARRADHPALIFDGGTLTYGEVHRRTDDLARGLMGRGIRPGDVVGLWMRRGPDLLRVRTSVLGHTCVRVGEAGRGLRRCSSEALTTSLATPAPVAQRIAQRPSNPWVAGSSPAGGASTRAARIRRIGLHAPPASP